MCMIVCVYIYGGPKYTYTHAYIHLVLYILSYVNMSSSGFQTSACTGITWRVVKPQTVGPLPQSFWVRISGKDPRICLSDKFQVMLILLVWVEGPGICQSFTLQGKKCLPQYFISLYYFFMGKGTWRRWLGLWSVGALGHPLSTP